MSGNVENASVVGTASIYFNIIIPTAAESFMSSL